MKKLLKKLNPNSFSQGNLPFLTKYLPFATMGGAAVIILSLAFGWLNVFFGGTITTAGQGFGYFSAPKSYLNLLAHLSPYNTWAYVENFDPHTSYALYLAHPAFSVFVASWFSFFAPWTSYWLFALFSIGVLAYCGYAIAGTTLDPLKKRLSYFLMICTFPAYWILFTGNIHAVFVLGITLIFVGVFYHTYGNDIRKANATLLAGLLITLLTKPVALLMLPVLLLTRETRSAAIKGFAIYVVVSALFIVIPVLNPEGIGLSRLAHIAFDFDFVRQNMNIFQNNLVVNEYMKDNSFHWLNLIAQSDFRYMGNNIFSFPVFLDTIAGSRLPSFIYQFPIFIGVGLSGVIPFMSGRKKRLETCLLLLFAISILYFIGYNTVWEYQFTSLFPVVALLPVLSEKGVFYKRYVPLMFWLGAIVAFPSLFILAHLGHLSEGAVSTISRLDRIVPVYLLFWTMITPIILIAKDLMGNSKQVPEIKFSR